MAKIFTKLHIGDAVSSSGTRVFKKLTTEEPLPIWNGTDLTGTKWKIKSGWSAEAGYGEFDVGGISWDIEGKVGAGYTRLCIGYSTDSPIPDSTLFPATNSIVFRSLFNGIMSDTTVGRSFSFTYGTDLTNKSLINWLLENAELTSHTYVPVTAGLYDANDNLVASWDTLVNTYGMDVEKDYTSSTYNTDAASPYCVLTNNSELSTGTKLVVGDSVTAIGDYAFYNCISLSDITLGESVTAIGMEAFAKCQKLKTFSVPDSVTILSSGVFTECTGLLNVNIGKGLSGIELGIYEAISTFDGCDSLSGIWVDEQNQYYSSDKQGVLYDKNKTALMKAPAQIIGRCDIPSSVTNIYPYAFAYCTRLTGVTIRSALSIGNCAFRDCTGLVQISLGTSISIGTAAFYNCSSLTELTIPDTVTSIEPKAFSGCASIKSMVIPDSATGSFSSGKCEFDVTERNDELFENCTSLASVTLGKGIWIINNSTFIGCTSLATVNLPDNIQDIYKNAFADCPNLQYAFYGNNDKYLGNESNPYLALISLTDKTLTNYNIHADTKLLAQGSFDGCTATNITIPDGIMRIDEYLFSGCAAMTSIILPATIVFIGFNAFNVCNNLTNVYYRGTEEQWGSINLRPGNSYLTDAIIHYNYTD